MGNKPKEHAVNGIPDRLRHEILAKEAIARCESYVEEGLWYGKPAPYPVPTRIRNISID